MMKIKDLPPNFNLRGALIRTPEGKEMYWWSQWNKGVWLKESMDADKVLPYSVSNLEECFDWEVIKEKEDE